MPDASPPQPPARHVHGDGRNPRFDGVWITELIEPLVNNNEHVLDDVLHFLVGSHNATRDACHVPSVPLVRDVERNGRVRRGQLDARNPAVPGNGQLGGGRDQLKDRNLIYGTSSLTGCYLIVTRSDLIRSSEVSLLVELVILFTFPRSVRASVGSEKRRRFCYSSNA